MCVPAHVTELPPTANLALSLSPTPRLACSGVNACLPAPATREGPLDQRRVHGRALPRQRRVCYADGGESKVQQAGRRPCAAPSRFVASVGTKPIRAALLAGPTRAAPGTPPQSHGTESGRHLGALLLGRACRLENKSCTGWIWCAHIHFPGITINSAQPQENQENNHTKCRCAQQANSATHKIGCAVTNGMVPTVQTALVQQQKSPGRQEHIRFFFRCR